MKSKNSKRSIKTGSRVKIYTRTGDDGKTSLYGGTRVEKHNLRVVAYGTVDELNSVVGVLISHLEKEKKLSDFFHKIQSDLLSIGSHLALGKSDLVNIKGRDSEMEVLIDSIDEKLEPLKNFILPGGTKAASFSHLARSVCRRAEREVVRLYNTESNVDRLVLVYLNRLSDLFFETARYLNKMAKVKENVWLSTK
ncbi:MAG: cob(I)yrinic acid a,c-diamide adenosyltransferase [Patescibacteria group bacterium]|nr:cob(I)yrinic acid a,c-diamide adenosyltransferase [Patescibacteria group bacterium]